ncbi:MAG TPA: hypothetical protein DCP63_12845 [Bacteroidetes bacterium]|nr:hypothetical protein [Bacteroidota bacterium]
MKNSTRVSFLSILSIALAVSVQAQLLLTEDFAGAAGTALTSASWVLSGTNNTNPLTIGSPGLTFSGYPGSGVGNALPMTNNGQDLYRSFTATNSGSVYLSFMVNVSAALTGDYFIALSPSSSQTNYYARLHVKSSGSGYSFGMNKSNEVTGGAKYGTTVCNLNATYLVVIKYSFTGPAADTLNDPINVYVFGSGANIAAEPATPEISGYVVNTRTDAADLSSVTLRQGSSTAAPTIVIDGIRVSKSWNTMLTGVESTKSSIPATFSLSQNYPNPFNPSTAIRFQLPTASFATLKVFDVLGREVATLVNEMRLAGSHVVRWDGLSSPSGVYVYRLTAGEVSTQSGGRSVETRTMILLR